MDKQILIISAPSLDPSFIKHCSTRRPQGNPRCSRTTAACPHLSSVWPLGQIHKPLDFLMAVLLLNLLFIPTVRVSTQGSSSVLTEVEPEAIPRWAYVWTLFLIPFLGPGENNIHLNGAHGLWNLVFLDMKIEKKTQQTSCHDWYGSVDWAWSCQVKGHRFDSWSGHTPGLWDRSTVGVH